ncbi:MAG: DUF2321 domain-containing protein [Candidatus Acidiferrales bacterium]
MADSVSMQKSLTAVGVVQKNRRMRYSVGREKHGFDVSQVCLNGHLRNAFSLTNRERCEKFCSDCGAETITACLDCKADIRGYLHSGRFHGMIPEDPPSFCHQCGHPYPWTAKRLDAARELTDEATDLKPDEKETLKASFDDLVRDTPKTALAAQRFQKLWAKLKGPTADGLKEIFVQVATETAKRLIFPTSK